MTNNNLTTPLKCWKDQKGRDMYRLGDLPVGIEIQLLTDGPTAEVISYARSSHTGKRQCKDLITGKVFYEYCSRKVYVVS